jgi:protoheme IX farnesyltransferase
MLMGAGFLTLLAGAGTTAAWLGIFAVLWYNGVYTPLKRKSAFASIPGALTGALPPLLGWSAGGGSLGDPGAGALALCFVIWQIPHFWLLLLHYGGEYEKAGLPSLTRIWSRRQLVRLTFIWTLCAAIISLLLPLYRTVIYPFAAVALALAAVWLVFTGTALFRSRESDQAVVSAFGRLNAYLLLVMLCLSLDRLTGMLLGAV